MNKKMKELLDAAEKAAANAVGLTDEGIRELAARRRFMHYMTFRAAEIRAGKTVMLRGTVSPPVFVVDDMRYQTNYVPDTVPWWWRYRVTRWIAKTIFRRHAPITITPFLITAFAVGGDLWFLRPIPVHAIARDITDKPPVARDKDGELIYPPPTLSVPVAIPKGTPITITITNTHKTKSASLYLGLQGWCEHVD